MMGVSTACSLLGWIKSRLTINSIHLESGATPVIAYGHIGFPGSVRSSRATLHGGSVKYLYLDQLFPHNSRECNILYIVSSGRFPFLDSMLQRARSQGVKILWNQNGALFPSAYGKAAVAGNAELSQQLQMADHVFYQSRFAKLGSDHFLGKVNCPNEILYNAIDTSWFTPAEARGQSNTVRLLLCGSHNDSYRIPLALDVLKALRDDGGLYELKIAGRIPDESVVMEAIRERALEDSVALLGAYTQDQAPDIYRQGDLLLHTQYNDVCTSVVLEAMSCGLPVAYSHSGGTPELVGDEAGEGVPAELDWEKARPPADTDLAGAVERLRTRLVSASEAARARAVKKFDLQTWLQRHAEVFHQILEEK
jgi:glycosyltransferase involved in cell wall biosynthesis